MAMSELELLFKYLDAMGTLKVCAMELFRRTHTPCADYCCTCFLRAGLKSLTCC